MEWCLSILVGAAIVVLHSAFRYTEDLVLDEDRSCRGVRISLCRS